MVGRHGRDGMGSCRLDRCNAVGSAIARRAAAAVCAGVVTTIPPDFLPDDTVSTHDIVEIRAEQGARMEAELSCSPSRTLYGMASGVKFRRDVWCLEFSFKPLRMIERDTSGGPAEARLVSGLPRPQHGPGAEAGRVARTAFTRLSSEQGGPLRFLPQFVLESQRPDADGERYQKAYLDRVIPAAVAAIRDRETARPGVAQQRRDGRATDPGQRRPHRQGVWGVATWTDVDPRIDFFSVTSAG